MEVVPVGGVVRMVGAVGDAVRRTVRGVVRRGRVGVTAGALLAGSLVLAPTAVAAPGAVGAGSGREAAADLDYHGRVVLAQGRLTVWLVPENRGPVGVENATVRFRFSAAPGPRQELSEGCARTGAREVVCETGALPAHGTGRHIGLVMRLRERPAEVTVRIDTWWNGGPGEGRHGGDEQVVLALDTGDAYAF
ncbi:hypothetical protein ACN20G_14260 [Streptomyces sp. BI20]|uniref:hypothetical protein n=1 Tax=Streptomyces sp. BI20 TaxID=3403460 RepID=UPI003C734D54